MAIACATPVLAYLGVLTANRNTRASAVELEDRERRKQNLELMHKAVEWAVSSDDRLATAGVSILLALDRAGLLSEEDQPILNGALNAVVAEVLEDDDLLLEVEDDAT